MKMTPRALALSLACLTTLALPALLQAQGLRPSRSGGGFELGGGTRAAEASGQRQADYIVAVVNSEPITNNEVRLRATRAERQIAAQGGTLPPREQLLSQVLERLIAEKAQVQHARDIGIKIDEASVDQAEMGVAQQNRLEVAELRRRLSSEGVSPAQLREDLRNQLLLQRLRERELDARVKVTDQDIDQFIREQRESTQLGNLEINLGHVLVAVPENANAAQVNALQARAQRVAERARAGADFAALAAEFSDAPERASGGQLGLRNAERYPPLFIDATQKLAVGAVAGPLRSGAGFHVLKVLEKRQGGVPGASVTQSRARHILLRTSAQRSEAQAIEQLNAMRQRLQSGQADFATLARENSQDGSAREGGDLGWANPGQFVPEFEEVMNSLTPGEISRPLVSRFGVHLIQLVERREAQLSEREQRAAARNLVRERKLDEAYEPWAREIRGRAYVEMREPPQ
jgi:peptidyl-prolyl cis-trans isomerase SurA